MKFEIGVQLPDKFVVWFSDFKSWDEANLYRTRYYVQTRTCANLSIRETPAVQS